MTSELRRRWTVAAILIIAAAALVVQAAAYRSYVCDDAYISLRYARRLVDGRGLTWTDGERVEGYSNLLWLLACAVGGSLGLDLVTAARVVGGACTGIALWSLARSHRTAAGAALATMSFALAGPIAVWSIGGLEPPMVAAFLVLAAIGALRAAAGEPVASWRTGLALAALALTRPDGILLCAAIVVAVAIARRSPSVVARMGIPAIAAVVAQLIFRRVYYHAWLPNTAFAKLRPGAAALREGVAYLRAGALGASGLMVLGAVGLALAGWRRALVIALPLVAWLAYVTIIGGDWMPAHRQLVAAIVLLALAAGQAGDGLACLGRDARIRLALVAATALVWFGLTQLFDPDVLAAHAHDWARRQGEPLGKVLKEGLGARDPLLAVDAAGSIVYASQMRALDMLGLCDAWIAHHPPRRSGELSGHALGDGDYVLSRAPDLVIFRGPEGGDPVFVSGRQMIRDPRFAAYERVTLAVDDWRSVLFVRRRGRAGIDGDDVPGWLFANVDGNVARLRGGALVGELSAPSTIATGRAGVRLLAVDPPSAAVAVTIDERGNLTARPLGHAPVVLRKVVLRQGPLEQR